MLLNTQERKNEGRAETVKGSERCCSVEDVKVCSGGKIVSVKGSQRAVEDIDSVQ